MAAADAKLSQTEVPGTSQFEARGDKGSVEIKDRSHLNLDSKGRHAGREGRSIDNPSAAVGEDLGEP